MAALDQAGDDGDVAEGAFHHGVARKPAFQPLAQVFQIEQRGRVEDRLQPPDQRGVVGGDKAQGGKARLFHPFGEQEAEGLLSIAPGKAVDTEMFAPVLGEAFGQQAVRLWQARDLALQGQPFGGVARQVRPAVLLENFKNPGG